MSLIEIGQLAHSFGTAERPADGASSHEVLHDVNLSVAQGEFLVIVGPSGCGKSTLLDLVAGLSPATQGRIAIDGQPVTGPGLERAVVFQQYALLPWRTAAGNIEFALEATRSYRRRERRARALEYLRLVGLEQFADRYPHQLSGGMKQRVAIARSLSYEPKILLMDEPFAALDAQTREGLQAELRRIWRTTGTTVVFVTHSIEEAVYLGQRVAVMTAGPGTIKQVVRVPELDHSDGADVRSSDAFAATRHDIWRLLHDEVSEVARREQEWSAAAEVAS